VEDYCVGATMAIDWGEGECPAVSRPLLRRVFSYFRPYGRRGLLVTACIAVDAALGLAPAVVFKALIDYLGRPGGHFGHVLLLVAAGIGAAVIGGLVNVVESYHSAVISQNIVFALRRQLFERLLDQSVGFFTKNRSGDVLSRLTNDVGGVETVITDTVFGLVRNVIVAAATLALMLRFSWQLTLVVLVLIPIVGLPTSRFGRASYRARARTQGKLAQLTGYLQEILGTLESCWSRRSSPSALSGPGSAGSTTNCAACRSARR